MLRRFNMINLKTLLSSLGYDEIKIKAIARVLLLTNDEGRNTFATALHLLGSKHSVDIQWINCAKVSNSYTREEQKKQEIWLDKIKESNIVNDIKACLLNSNDPLTLIQYDFNCNPQTLFEVLVCLTQLQFNIGSKFNRFNDDADYDEFGKKSIINDNPMSIVEDLGLTKPKTYQEEDGELKSIFLHAGSEITLVKRLKIIKELLSKQKNKLTIYYFTNPRGLSKNETSTAKIIAKWIEPNDLQQQVKIAHTIQMDWRKTPLDWHNGLNLLKKRIVELLKLDKFPSAPMEEIYDDSYDLAAKHEERDSLNNAWPHTGHLLNYLASELQIADKVNITVVPVPGTLVEDIYKPNQTKELVEALLRDHKCNVLSNETIYAVSDNSVTYSAGTQDLIFKLVLVKYGYKTKKLITYHDSLQKNQIYFERILKEVANEFHTLYETGLNLEDLCNMKDNRTIEPQTIRA